MGAAVGALVAGLHAVVRRGGGERVARAVLVGNLAGATAGLVVLAAGLLAGVR